jgi:regulator of sirC expression with transglutaminase-like and TPR domain
MDSASTEKFLAATRGADHEVDLFGGAMIIASLGGQEPSAHATARELDLIAEAVRAYAGDTTDPETLAGAVDYQLFAVLGFHGNTAEYADPANSYLDQVVERRTGLPITLSLVYMEVAQRIGLLCEGVGYPGHFIVRCGGADAPIYVDPFHQGARLDPEELLAGLRSYNLHGARPESFIAAVTRRQFLQRMLLNLHSAFRERRDIVRWRSVVDLLLCLEPWNATLIGERGMLHYRLGDSQAALADLERYVEATGAGLAPPGAIRMLDELRSRETGLDMEVQDD